MGWRWQSFGGQLMLVTDGGGAKVVLGAEKVGKFAHINTRDPATGVLRVLKADDEAAKLIAAAPDLLEAMKRVQQELTIPAAEYVPAIPACWEIINDAIAKAEGKQ